MRASDISFLNVNELTFVKSSGGESICTRYNIPAYQRGYRWTKNEVRTLLDDIWDFLCVNINNVDARYCLQPIVLKKNAESTSCVTWDVIDGQQRLTTLFLIMKYLSIYRPAEERFFKLTYTNRETGNKLEEWEGSIKECKPQGPHIGMVWDKNKDNLDSYYMSMAIDEIYNWIGEKKKDLSINSIDRFYAFREKVFVIRYEITPENDFEPMELFSRLNVGKIPLTDAELIKAMLFKKERNFDEASQNKIAAEWDRVEQELADDEFFYFLCSERNVFELRIDYLFRLNYEIKIGDTNLSYDNYEVFKYYCDKIKEERNDKIKVWEEIYNLHSVLKEWASNREFFHRIGFLVASCRINKRVKNEATKILRDLYGDYNKTTKNGFKDVLDKRIKDAITKSYNDETRGTTPLMLEQLNYKDHPKTVEIILLLFNVVTMNKFSNNMARFSFEKFLPKYPKDEWSLEHIYPQNPPKYEKGKTDLLKELSDAYLKELEVIKKSGMGKNSEFEKLEKELSANKDCGSSEIGKIIDACRVNIDGKMLEEDIDSISNLALLQKGINAGLSNQPFFGKRKYIIDKEKKGEFIPLCTHNAFLKYYSEIPGRFFSWNEEDRLDYYKTIKEIVGDFLANEGGEINAK